MMMMMATLSMWERGRGRERKEEQGEQGQFTFHSEFQCRQTDHFLRSCFLPLSPRNDNKFIHFVQDLVAYNRRNDGLTDPARR